MYWFASSTEIPPVKAERLFDIGSLSIHNSTLLGFFITVAVVVFLVWIARQTSVRPSRNKFVSIVEASTEYSVNLLSEIMGSREKAIKYSPLVLSLFFVILINNWVGLLPGVGHSLLATVGGEHVPLLRGFTSDLNNTLALALLTIVLVQIYSIKELGGIGYLARFFTYKPYNPVNLFVGILEVISEITKVISLSFRLFGNIFAGEVLIVVIMTIAGYFAPVAILPFIAMEIFAGFIQAFVFAILTVVYLTISTSGHGDHDEEKDSANNHSHGAVNKRLATSE